MRRPALLVALVGIGLTVAIVLVATDDDPSPPAGADVTTADTTTATTAAPLADTARPTIAAGGAEGDRDLAGAAASNTVPGPELPDRGPHEELEQIDGWLQSDVTSLEELRGDVVAVQFWTFGCSNCRATLPHLRALYAEHGDEDFEIVGIHSPELAHEEDPAAVAAAAADLGVTWPIALDTSKRTFFGWQGGRGFWPRLYLLDRDGHVRYDHIGEGRYAEIDAAVRALLAEPA